YKYHATLRIAEIQTINGNFSSAMNSLKSTKTKYQFSHFCINSFSYVDYNFDVHLAEIEFQKGNKDDAIDLIQPYLFSNEFNSENTTPIQLIQWLKKDYSEEQINSSLIKSLSDVNSFNINSNEKLEIQVNDLNIQFEIPLSLLDIHSDSLQEMDRR